MKAVSWNVNGIRSIMKKELLLSDQKLSFEEWIKGFDIIALQETKADSDCVSALLSEQEEFYFLHSSAQKKGYSGVAILSKEKPLDFEILGEDLFDHEGRIIIGHYKEFSLVNAYFPNSQEGGRRLDYKLKFCGMIEALMDRLTKEKTHPVILCGDYNIAHKPIDLDQPANHEKDPGYLPQEREWIDHFFSKGYFDCFRKFNSEPNQYSWWSYRTRARSRNAGWRIDYVSMHQSRSSCLQSCDLLHDIHGSDHCPVQFEI